MTPEMASGILEIVSTDEESVRDAYEEKFFLYRQIFLKDPVIPKVFAARLQKMAELEKAAFTFQPALRWKKNSRTEWADLKLLHTWHGLWTSYENNKAKIRSAISSGMDLPSVEMLVSDLLENERTYAEILLHHARNIPETDSKMSEAVSTVALMYECESLKNSAVIDDTLSSLERLSDKNANFSFSKEVNRLRKMIRNG